MSPYQHIPLPNPRYINFYDLKFLRRRISIIISFTYFTQSIKVLYCSAFILSGTRGAPFVSFSVGGIAIVVHRRVSSTAGGKCMGFNHRETWTLCMSSKRGGYTRVESGV